MSKEEELLAELLQLTQKYGTETCRRLAILLDDPEAMDNVRMVLRGANAVSPSSPSGHSALLASKPGVVFLRNLEKYDPEKSAYLSKVRDDILDGTVFRDLYDAKQFAEQQGISIGSAKSRRSIINPVLKCLANYSIEEASDLLRVYDPSDRSLERWTAVIMGEKA